MCCCLSEKKTWSNCARDKNSQFWTFTFSSFHTQTLVTFFPFRLPLSLVRRVLMCICELSIVCFLSRFTRFPHTKWMNEFQEKNLAFAPDTLYDEVMNYMCCWEVVWVGLWARTRKAESPWLSPPRSGACTWTRHGVTLENLSRKWFLLHDEIIQLERLMCHSEGDFSLSFFCFL